MDTPSNVRIIVRIRAPDVPEKSSNQEDKENQQKSQKPVNSSKSKSPVNKPRQLTKSPTNSTKPKKKVTPEKVVAVQTNTLRENVKYSIFTSLEPSNTIVISNSPISGKLINNTFHNSNDLYEYSYSLIKDASIMEFDRVYNEIHK